MMVLSKDALHVVESSNNRPDGTRFLKLSERQLEGEERQMQTSGSLRQVNTGQPELWNSDLGK